MLSYIIDNLDSIPAPFRSEYTAKDGKFHLNVDGLDDTTGLKSALAAEREANREIKAISKKLGKPIAEIETLLSAPLPTDRSIEFSKLMQQREQAWNLEKTTLVTERDAAKTSEVDSLTNAVIAQALIGAKVTSEGIDLLPQILAKQIQFSIADGKRTISVRDSNGKLMKGSGPDGTATVNDLVISARAQYPSLFEGTGANGSGTDPKGMRRDAGGKILTRTVFESLSPTEKMARVKAGYSIVD